jgi:hypothetical protein
MLCTIKYYDDEKRVYMSPDFETFSSSIANMLEIDENLLNSVIIFYLDKENDRITIQNEDDYGELLEQIQKKEVKMIQIELNPEKMENNNDNQKFNINQINMQKNNNQIYEHNYQINKINYQINNQNNNQINNQNKDLLTQLMGNNNSNEIIFPIDCSKCHLYPIKNVIYKCTECMLFYCENCEKIEGINHEHALYKIRNREHFFKLTGRNELNNQREEGTFEKLFSNIKNGISNLISGFDENEQNKNTQKMVQILRSNYDLNSIPDSKIIEALNKTNGNIEEAINFLFQ